MASRAEQQISHWLRTNLTDLPNGADLETAESFRDMVLSGLESFLPEVLREIYPALDSLDGIYPVLACKTGEREAEIFGLCIFISDQTLTPVHLRIRASNSSDEVSWLECRLGEKGERGMVKTPYDFPDRAMKRLYLLDRNPDRIDWVYKVKFGQR